MSTIWLQQSSEVEPGCVHPPDAFQQRSGLQTTSSSNACLPRDIIMDNYQQEGDRATKREVARPIL